MTTLKYLVVTFSLILCAACWSIAQAQMPALDVAIDSDQVRFVAEAQELRVEVYAPSGEMIFDSGAVTGQSIDWRMQNAKGERVADGVYLVTISMKTAAGQVRKRIEQVMVGREQQEGNKPSSPNSPSATITGTGTTGKIAKFTNTTVIGNSVMTEASGKIGIGITTPTAFFHVKEAGSDTIILANSTGTGIGVHGISFGGNGVFGKSTSTDGVYGTSGGGGSAGVHGASTADGGTGVRGEANTGFGFGVSGASKKGTGVQGTSTSGTGMEGDTTSGVGVIGSSQSGTGVDGISQTGSGVKGMAFGTGAGVSGSTDSGAGVSGTSADGGIGVLGMNTGTGPAGKFSGNVQVTGNLSKASGSFKIDHPLDPAHKYLYHSFVESPDMMNIYNGNVTLDQTGEAVVTMPRWFSALNREFRYQLTAIGAPGPNLYIAEEVKGNHFKIAGGAPGMKISWQLTGIRKDAWAEAHRIPVEEEKSEKERGFYLHPELFNQPEEKGIDWALYPEMMKKLKEEREVRQQQQPPAVKQ